MNQPSDVFPGFLDEAVPPLAVSRELEDELANLRPVRVRRPHRQFAIVMACGLVYAGAVLALLAIRRDIAELPVAWLAGVAGLWFSGFAATTYYVLVPARGTVIARWPIATGIACAAAAGFVMLGLLVHPTGPSSVTYGWEHFLRGHACLEIGLAVAIVPTTIGAFFLRRTSPTNVRLLAAALGAGGGCAGGLVLHFFCRITDGPHVGLIHGGVVGVAMLLASWAAARIIDPA